MLNDPSPNKLYSGYMSDSHTSRTGPLSKSLSKQRLATQLRQEEVNYCDKSMNSSNQSMGQKLLNKLFKKK